MLILIWYFDAYHGDALRRELENFVECCTTKACPLVTGDDGRRALEVALEIRRQIVQ